MTSDAYRAAAERYEHATDLVADMIVAFPGSSAASYRETGVKVEVLDIVMGRELIQDLGTVLYPKDGSVYEDEVRIGFREESVTFTVNFPNPELAYRFYNVVLTKVHDATKPMRRS